MMPTFQLKISKLELSIHSVFFLIHFFKLPYNGEMSKFVSLFQKMAKL